MAGTITISMTQRFDNSTHLPLSGGLIYFIQAGTTSTPQNAYQDSALSIPYANPLELDDGGNVPQLFFADGVIKIRITNRLGIQQLVQDNIQVTGASSGGGGGGTVDPTTILATGDVKARYGAGVLTGFVRANGRTLGSATSGATEYANAGAQALFEFLWNADSTLSVSTGRGASANADWVANKTIALPDCRGRTLAGADGMGNSAAGRLTLTYFGIDATLVGAAGGSQFSSTAPAHTHVTDTLHHHLASSGTLYAGTGFGTLNYTAGQSTLSVLTGHTDLAGILTSDNTAGTITETNSGGATSATIPPTIIVTLYLKL